MKENIVTMHQPVSYRLLLQQMCLLPRKAIFWVEKKTLLVADLHLGKASHFRKAGIPVPAQVHGDDLAGLASLVRTHGPERLLILGDLFHSDWNTDWYGFAEWLAQFPGLSVHLVKGNHDRLPDRLLAEAGIHLHPETLIDPPFIFSHIPLATPITDLYNLSGHLHPAVRLLGRGGRSLSLPCFYFGKTSGLLPAFGQFTGTALIRPRAGDVVFVASGAHVVCVSQVPE